MSERTNHFKVGVFVLVGFGLLILALFALGLGSYFAKGRLFETYIDGGVDNLSLGALVRLRGVTIGKVTDISFIDKEQPQYKEQAVRILFEVPKSAGVLTAGDNVQEMLDKEVAQGLRARVEALGFLGPSYISLEYVDPKLYPVEPVAWTPKYYYIPSAHNRLDHVMDALEKTLSQTEGMDLSGLEARAQKLVEAANHLVDNINRIDFNSLGTNANSLVVEFRETNRGIQRTLADAQEAIKSAQGAIKSADVAGLSRSTKELETRLMTAVGELRRLLASVDTGELNGSLANVRAATDELTVLLHSLEEQPSSVLFSKPPKPVSGVEEPPKR